MGVLPESFFLCRVRLSSVSWNSFLGGRSCLSGTLCARSRAFTTGLTITHLILKPTTWKRKKSDSPSCSFLHYVPKLFTTSSMVDWGTQTCLKRSRIVIIIFRGVSGTECKWRMRYTGSPRIQPTKTRAIHSTYQSILIMVSVWSFCQDWRMETSNSNVNHSLEAAVSAPLVWHQLSTHRSLKDKISRRLKPFTKLTQVHANQITLKRDLVKIWDAVT